MSDNTGIFPRFYMGTKEDKVKSKEAGRPIFKDVEMIEIRIAGDNKNIIDTRVDDQHKQRWPNQYEAFLEQKEQPMEGTPIAQLTILTESKRQELLAINIRTVEALANLNENGIKRLGMGGRELVKKAVAYMKQAEGMAPVNGLIEENKKLQEEVDAMKMQMSELIKANQAQEVAL